MSTDSPSPSAMTRDELEDEVNDLRDRVEQLEEFAESMTAPEAPDGANQIIINDAPVGARARKQHDLVQNLATYLFDGVVEEYANGEVEEYGPYDIEQVLENQDLLPARLDGLDADINDEQDKRASEDAKLRRFITALGEKAGVDVTDADILGDDKIARAMRHGASDIVDGKVWPVHERAVTLLRNADTWGRQIKDANGRRFTITAPELKDRMGDKRDESLSSTDCKRVFRKVESWGADSPRKVVADLSGETNRLVISLEETP